MNGRLGVTLGAVLALAACQPGAGPGFLQKDRPTPETVAGADPAAPALAAGEERDVEAPDIFKLTDKALWDGRPSLGGVWVAHASVTNPERALIRNAANGKSVVGALFRREVDVPGPSLQLSSDAAEALGLLAGQPAVIEVVALKRVEAPAAPAPAAVPPAPQTKPAAKPAAAAAADAPPPEDQKKKKKKGQIEEKKLDPVAATAAAAIEKATGKPAAASAPAAAPAATVPAAAGTLRRAYVQIGIFSVEANAKKAAAQLQKAGMSAEVKAGTSQGKTIWRVIVGPAATEADRNALVAKVKGLGYPDAYPVSK